MFVESNSRVQPRNGVFHPDEWNYMLGEMFRLLQTSNNP